MILNYKASETQANKAASDIGNIRARLELLSSMHSDKIVQLYDWSPQSEKDAASAAAELTARFKKAADSLAIAQGDLWSLASALKELQKKEDVERNAELEKLKAEVADKEAKVRALFQLDEQNCELKRKLKELEGQTATGASETTTDN